jgi:glucosylceramidase
MWSPQWSLFVLYLVVIASAVQVRVVQTAKDSTDRLSPKPPISFTNEYTWSRDEVVLKIDTNIEYQEILGFGGAFTEASAYVYYLLDKKIQNRIMDLYFGADGLQYSVGRVHIGSCDFSLKSYNFDNFTDDFSLSRFDISHDKRQMIPFIKQALNTSKLPIKIYATPWSPPGWMKGNGHMVGTSEPGLKQDDAYHKTWANYLSMFITAYKKEGVDLWGMTVQNEAEAVVPWESCYYSPENERDFIKNFLGPIMSVDHPNLTIMIWDHNKDRVVPWVKTIFSDPEAAKYVKGTGIHWYSGSQFENVEEAHKLFPEKFILATEACNCPGVLLGDWSRGESYGYDIIGDLNAYAVGWVDWNLLLNAEGGPNHLNNFCDASLIGDVDNQILHIQPTYYYMGQISKFLLPGSKRVNVQSSSNVNGTLSYVGVVTPNDEVAIVVMNQANNTVDLRFIDNGMTATYALPPRAITTFIYPRF